MENECISSDRVLLFITLWTQHRCLNNKKPPVHPSTVQLSSVQISQFSTGHSTGRMKGLFMNTKMWGKVTPVSCAHWWQCMRIWIRLQKLAERGEDVWNEHFTACSYNMYCMCCTCKRESGAQIWYKGLLENITWNIQFVFFSFYSTVWIFSLTFNYCKKNKKIPVVTQTTKLCNTWI